MAFFHGDPWTGLFIPLLVAPLVGVVVFAATAFLFYIWLRNTKLPALYLTFPYLFALAVLCVLLAISSADSVLFFISFLSSFILTLPWSALGRWGLRALLNSKFSNTSFAAVILFGAGLNAVILCYGSVMVRRLIK